MSYNRYDTSDIVRRIYLMNAEGLKFASYRVRDMAAEERGVEKFSILQHHLTHVPVKMFTVGGERHAMVNEIGATVYATLDDEQVSHLAEVLQKIEQEGDDFEPRAFVDLERTKTVIQAYRHPESDKIELQIWRGETILGILGLSTAKMFCTCAEHARGGLKSMAGDMMQSTEVCAVAGEVDKALHSPLETITAAQLDADAQADVDSRTESEL